MTSSLVIEITESFRLPKAPLRIQDLLFSTCMESRTCRHCGCVVEYPDGTAEKYANILLDKHLEVCHSTPRASTSTSPVIAPRYFPEENESCATSTLVGESGKTSPSLSTAETPSLPDETTENILTAPPSAIGSFVSSKKARAYPQKREMDEAKRRINLEEDLYTADVRPKRVRCTECSREISLDKRWNYYDYPWRKHRRTCVMIKVAEEKRLRREAARNEAFFSETARSTPHEKSPDGTLSRVKVEELGSPSVSTRGPTKRPRDSSDDPQSPHVAKRLKDCDS